MESFKYNIRFLRYLNDPPPPADDKKFSQDDVNKMLADHKRALQKDRDTLASQLEELKKSKNLSDEERTVLATKIEELQNANLTTEEKAKKEREKIENEYKGKLDSVTTESKLWQQRFLGSTINQALTSAAVTHGAFNPSQIIAVLGGNARVVQKEEDGKPIEDFEVKVKYAHIKDGKTVLLDLTVDEALKYMKDTPELYGNLFKANLNGGAGLTNTGTGAGNSPKNATNPDPKWTQEQYDEWRKNRGW
jgi:hypothetical protein